MSAIPALPWPTPARPADLRDVVLWSATELSGAIRGRVVSCVEVMTAYLDHIDRVNPAVNAIVDLRPRETLIAEAAEKDRLIDQGRVGGWMHGFPHAVKDLADIRGWTTSRGFFRPPHVPTAATEDEIFVERIREAGAIFIGRTNTPEFGLGSHTFNEVYGATGNAYDPALSAGGSSGGAAVAVALRMVPVADGSDFMGSLRNPPGWNNVLGMRPSVGRVPSMRGDQFTAQGGVQGPIARTAQDLALLLATMSGADLRSPLSITEDPSLFVPIEERDVEGLRIGWLGDLGGHLPMEPGILETTRRSLDVLEENGAVVVDVGLPAHGTFRGVDDLWPTWLTYRHWSTAVSVGAIYAEPTMRALMKPETIFEVEGALGGSGNPPMTAMEFAEASLRRTHLYEAMRQLFTTVDVVMLPTAQVFPFDVASRWPSSIAGVDMDAYHRWMEIATIATLINAPAVAMPAGFGEGGMPIGVQGIGPHRSERFLLSLARAWERLSPATAARVPALLAPSALDRTSSELRSVQSL